MNTGIKLLVNALEIFSLYKCGVLAPSYPVGAKSFSPWLKAA
jgi:hypothetical protein